MTTFIPNTWGSLGNTYYVAQHHPQASDANPGTPELPFKSISAAATVAEECDRILIDEGIYREQVPLVAQGHPFYPDSWIIYQAVQGKEVYVKGSDVFEAEWSGLGDGVYAADLPRAFFEDGAYNPYELPCCPRTDQHRAIRGSYPYSESEAAPREKVRPGQSEHLPETLGQIYVDDEALSQLDNVEDLRTTPGAFVVSADGKQILCNFGDNQPPDGRLVELAVRERCFKPTFPIPPGGVIIQMLGIRVEHAADPGPFSLCRPLSIRTNQESGIAVRKTLDVVNPLPRGGVLRSNFSYLSPDSPTILSRVRDGTKPLTWDKLQTITRLSDDGAKTWRQLESGPLTEPMANYFLDEENGMLLRYNRLPLPESDRESKSQAYYQQISPDAGTTWGPRQSLDFDERVLCYYTIVKLQSGRLLWFTTENRPELSTDLSNYNSDLFFVVTAWLGDWRPDLSGIDWEPVATLRVDPRVGLQGLDEPSACQLPDGRIFALFRQCGCLPSQDKPGFPNVKLYSVSEDEGRSWSEPKPLTYQDDKYVNTSVSFTSTFCSAKNGRVYVILNILNRPFEGCNPRSTLHIAEVDTESLSVKRDTITVVDELQDEHCYETGYSNWEMLEDRDTRNMLMFMKLENSPVYDGYDWNSYRYEIELPE